MDFPVWILEQLHVYVHLLKLSFKYHHLFFYSREIVSQKMTSKRFVSTFYSFQLKYKAPYTLQKMPISDRHRPLSYSEHPTSFTPNISYICRIGKKIAQVYSKCYE